MAAATDRLSAEATGLAVFEWLSLELDGTRIRARRARPEKHHERALVNGIGQRHGRRRQSHRARRGHRRVTSARAGPDDGPGEPPAPLWRHPRYGHVNGAMAEFLAAWS